jgi:hypothetical protein
VVVHDYHCLLLYCILVYGGGIVTPGGKEGMPEGTEGIPDGIPAKPVKLAKALAYD